MTDRSAWSVDLIAANNLATALGLKLEEAQLQLIAEHFSDHRYRAYEWAAKRAQSALLERLESTLLEERPVRSDAWASGFVAAEEAALTISTDQLLGLPNHRGRTQGQVLRAMMRQAKRA
jgi:hypothetical protein